MARLSTTRLLSTLAASVVALPAVASAQLDLNIALIKQNGEDCGVMECVNRGFNSEDCGGTTAAVDLRPATGTMVAGNMIDVWMTTGTGDCSTTEARNPMSATCQHVGCYDFSGDRFLVPLSEIDAASGSPLCDGTTRTGLTASLYAFAGVGCMNQDAVDAGATDNFSVKVDAVGPTAPTVNNDSVAGDNSVSVGWGRGDEATLKYRVYYGGSCTGTASDGGTGMVTPGELTLLEETELMTTSVTLNPDTDLGLALGESVAVYVAGVDIAGNEGELAGPVCVNRTESLGFCDEFTDCDEGGCSAGPVSGAGFGSLFLLALVVLRRKH